MFNIGGPNGFAIFYFNQYYKMANFVNLQTSATNFTVPMPFQHFTGDYAGATLISTKTNVQNANVCESECTNNPICELFKFTPPLRCELFNSGSSTVLSGIKIDTRLRGIGNSNIYSTQIPNTTAKPSTAATTAARSAEACETACNSDTTCFVYGYDISYQTCTLYSSTNSNGNVGSSRDLLIGLPIVNQNFTVTVGGNGSASQRTLMTFTITLTNVLPSDTFNLELRQTYTPSGLSSVLCSRVMVSSFTSSSIPTQILHDENIPGGTNYTLFVTYNGIDIGSSSPFNINRILTGITARAVYSSLRAHDTYTGPLFRVLNGATELDVYMDSVGLYRWGMTAVLLTKSINGLPVVTLYNQASTTTPLSTVAATRPLVRTDGSKYKFVLDATKQFILPGAVLNAPGTGGHIINIKLKSFTKGSDRRLIMGSGYATSPYTGPWLYIDINNKPAIAYASSVGAITTSSSQTLSASSESNFTWRTLPSPHRAWITKDGTTIEQATSPYTGTTAAFVNSITAGKVGGSVTLTGFGSLTPAFEGEISSIFVGANTATTAVTIASATAFNFETAESTTAFANLSKIRDV